MSRYELYKAVKHEVMTYHEDFGFTLVEIWDVVNGKAGVDSQTFWKNQCIATYKHDTEIERS